MFTFSSMKNYYYFLIFFFCFSADIQAQRIQILQQDTASSIRGLSVVDDQVAWISGSKGHVAISINGGKTWKWQQVKGFEQSDFRDIEAFSAQEVIIMSSGTPALILKTIDAGANWKVVYRNDDKAYFLDAMDFTDAKNGYVLGDPMNQKFLLLETHDYGEHWNMMSDLPNALPNEAAFAASGTCLRIYHGRIQIVTGGSVARLISQSLNERDWKTLKIPVKQGGQSQGAFSISGNEHLIIVGGDYVKNKESDSTAAFLKVPTLNPQFKISKSGSPGFQSCVAYLDHQNYLATGTSGSNITTDDGATWKLISSDSFNVCGKAKHGKLILLAGDKGKIAEFTNH